MRQRMLLLAVMIALLVGGSPKTEAAEGVPALALTTTSAGQISVICEDYSEHPPPSPQSPRRLLPSLVCVRSLHVPLPLL